MDLNCTKEIRKVDKKVKLCFITAYDINNEDFQKIISYNDITALHKKANQDPRNLAKELRQKLNEDFEIIS